MIRIIVCAGKSAARIVRTLDIGCVCILDDGIKEHHTLHELLVHWQPSFGSAESLRVRVWCYTSVHPDACTVRAENTGAVNGYFLVLTHNGRFSIWFSIQRQCLHNSKYCLKSVLVYRYHASLADRMQSLDPQIILYGSTSNLLYSY